MKKIEIAKKYFTEDELKRLIALCEIYCIDGTQIGLWANYMRNNARDLIRVYARSHGLTTLFSDTYMEKIQFYDENNLDMEFRIDGLFLKGVIEE